MSFNFEELLNKGQEAGDQVIKNNNEITEVLDSLETSMSNFLRMDIVLLESVEYERVNHSNKPLVALGIFNYPDKQETGNNIISIKHKEFAIEKFLFLLKRTNDGYPITVIYGKANYVAESQEEFSSAIGLVISTPKTNLLLREFKQDVEAAMEKNGSHSAE